MDNVEGAGQEGRSRRTYHKKKETGNSFHLTRGLGVGNTPGGRRKKEGGGILDFEGSQAHIRGRLGGGEKKDPIRKWGPSHAGGRTKEFQWEIKKKG